MTARNTAVAVCLLFVGTLGTSCKRSNSCPSKFADLPASTQATEPIQCTCQSAPAGAAVWGTGTYTTDSSICAAAVHAGAIPASGGNVSMKKAPGCPTYSGTAQNGVTSASWPSYGSSFYFPDKSAGTCSAPAAPAAGMCPGSFLDVPNARATEEFSCTCTGKTASSVWGSGVYTRDSNMCNAAIHAGAIPATGGKITVKASPACDKYTGSTKNGVTTGGWGHYDGSFYISGSGDGKCAP